MQSKTPDILAELRAIVGAAHVLTGADMAPFATDWMRLHTGKPLAVLRPGSTAEVSAVMAAAHAAGVAVVPISGNTGLVGGTLANGALLLSLGRMNRIRAVRPAARVAVVESGVILQTLHDAAEAEGLYFPLWFGARGSAMIGGALSTNAGGSNVLRYGSTRGLCLGVEVVLADGRVLDLMSELHKDNTGYALKDLFIGAEGTLGVITAAVMRLVPRARAHATAMVACGSLDAALELLNRLQEATGGLVEAFEYMAPSYMELLGRRRPDLGQPFAQIAPVTLLVELAATTARDATPGADGTVPLVDLLEEVLGTMMEEGRITDAVLARSVQQRRRMWERREAAAEITLGYDVVVDTDISIPLDRIAAFPARMSQALAALDPAAWEITIAHLGDGNIHYTALPSDADPAHLAAIRAAVDGVVRDLGGSFSAEHGIGVAKLASMGRCKDPVALEVMRSLKAALDPAGILNPGKVLPPVPDRA